jgi:hypothetical protein
MTNHKNPKTSKIQITINIKYMINKQESLKHRMSSLFHPIV